MVNQATTYVPLLRNEAVIERPVDQTTLTKRYTEEAIGFIEENKKYQNKQYQE